MSIKKKPVTQAIKQATMSVIFSARARVDCRILSMQTTIFDYQCNSVSSTAVKFRNHAAAAQHPLPILIIDGKKIILLYATFTYIRPGRVEQSVGHLTRKSGVLGSIPGLATYFRFSFRFFKKGSCQLLAKVCARSTG